MAQRTQTVKSSDLDISLRPAPTPMPKYATAPVLDALSKDTMVDAPVPYGTRSRHRSGSDRPNYSEDKDADTDLYELVPTKKDYEPKKSSRLSVGPSAQDPSRQAICGRKSTILDQGQLGDHQNGTTEQGPDAMVTLPAVNEPQPSKKRKTTLQANQAASNAPKVARGLSPRPTDGHSHTNMMSFSNCGALPKNRRLISDDGISLEPNDHVYLVCEPPGEPYYLGRIMEFLHVNNDPTKAVDALRINWYYRPKDIGRKAQDTRMIYATMHSDTSPLSALRGKCQVRHKAEILDLDGYRKMSDTFWYEKLYDRYIQKNYDLIPTSHIVNVPNKVKKVLDDRWKYILVEQGRGKELISAVKSCRRCSGYCASNDSVDCAVCKKTYHMNCVKPPLLKKPSRGFAWSCAACSRAQELRLEARNTPSILDPGRELDDDDYVEDDDDAKLDKNRSDRDDISNHQGTPQQIYQASLWPYRYLGMHCKVEDALDYDDRIYPRASSRIGPRHQANVLSWPGRPIVYTKPVERKTGKRDQKQSKEVQATVDAEKARREQSPWIQDEPPGYMARGEDLPQDCVNQTSTLLWRPPSTASGQSSSGWINQTHDYVDAAKQLSHDLDVSFESTNLQDAAIEALFSSQYDTTKALKVLSKKDRSELKEPVLTAAEEKKFEEGVSKFGSELHSVMRHIKSPNVNYGTTVRYYYTWKKSDRGKRIWGEYSGRKNKKEAKKAEAATSKMQDDVADDHDDSAYDCDKAAEKKKLFICKFCATKSSRSWRRAPHSSASMMTDLVTKSLVKDKGSPFIVALCLRCAESWRRYAIQWEDVDEVAKKAVQAGGRVGKRKQDEEVHKELVAVKDTAGGKPLGSPERPSSPIPVTSAIPTATHSSEPPRKKSKGSHEKEDKEKAVEKAAPASMPAPVPAPAPDMPKLRTLPCFVCRQSDPLDQHLTCRECRLSVHRNCYGVTETRNPSKWICDMCCNDKSPQASIHYQCVLCPVETTEVELFEPPPRVLASKKKSSEKERERERTELQMVKQALDQYRKRQEDLNRPVIPREALKRTADNNWVHITCAIFTSEVKFGNAKALWPAEGIPAIPRSRYDADCQLCGKTGAISGCHSCHASIHVACAHRSGWTLGFDVIPVKGSRRDQANLVSINGENGSMIAAVWCPDHVPNKAPIHLIHEMVEDSGVNALQLYAQNFKQADLSLTWTVRKASLISALSKMAAPVLSNGSRRPSTVAYLGAAMPSLHPLDADASPTALSQPGENVCMTCGIDVSPRWWPIDSQQEREPINAQFGTLGEEAQRFAAQRKFQCHKCHKGRRQPRSVHVPTASLQTAAGAFAAAGSARQPSLPPASSPHAPNSASPLHNILNPHVPLSPVQANQPAPRVRSAAPIHALINLAPRPYPTSTMHTGPPPVKHMSPPLVNHSGPPPVNHLGPSSLHDGRSFPPSHHQYHHHGSPPQQRNGSVSLSPSLSALSLRPPPVSGPVLMAPQHQNGYHVQPPPPQQLHHHHHHHHPQQSQLQPALPPPPLMQHPLSPQYVGGYPPHPPHHRQPSMSNGFPPVARPPSRGLMPTRYIGFPMAASLDNHPEQGLHGYEVMPTTAAAPPPARTDSRHNAMSVSNLLS